MIKVFCVNTGSCGGCDREIEAMLTEVQGFELADMPRNADIIVLTGPITPAIRPLLQALLAEAGTRPLVAVGGCAITGHPFGRGGIEVLPDLPVRAQISGCPPEPAAIAATLREVVGT